MATKLVATITINWTSILLPCISTLSEGLYLIWIVLTLTDLLLFAYYFRNTSNVPGNVFSNCRATLHLLISLNFLGGHRGYVRQLWRFWPVFSTFLTWNWYRCCPNRTSVIAKGVISIGRFGWGIINISQCGIGIISISQFTVRVFVLGQFAAAYFLIAPFGIFIHEGYRQVVQSLFELLRWHNRPLHIVFWLRRLATFPIHEKRNK